MKLQNQKIIKYYVVTTKQGRYDNSYFTFLSSN